MCEEGRARFHTGTRHLYAQEQSQLLQRSKPHHPPELHTMSLRLVPENKNLSSVSTTTFGEVSENSPALQDTLRAQEGPLNIASQLNNRHPLEGRIQNWEDTQQDTKLEMYRRVFGAGEPIKRTMELNIVEATDFKPQILGGSDSMHRDILLNREATVDWEDVYKGGFESGRHIPDFHSEMERKLGM